MQAAGARPSTVSSPALGESWLRRPPTARLPASLPTRSFCLLEPQPSVVDALVDKGVRQVGIGRSAAVWPGASLACERAVPGVSAKYERTCCRPGCLPIHAEFSPIFE